jgi:hypothetical protein
MKTWSSIVYDHFKLPPQIVKKGGEVCYVFVCKKHVIFFFPILALSKHDSSEIHPLPCIELATMRAQVTLCITLTSVAQEAHQALLLSPPSLMVLPTHTQNSG